MNGHPYSDFELIYGIVKRLGRKYYESKISLLRKKNSSNGMTRRQFEESKLLLSCLIAVMDGANGNPLDEEYCKRAMRGEFAELLLDTSKSDELVGQMAVLRGQLSEEVTEIVLQRLLLSRWRTTGKRPEGLKV